jgi:hypothetical protein
MKIEKVWLLSEARALVEAHRDKGIHCLCCDQMAREYKRKLDSAMAWGLIWLVRYSQSKDGAWVDLHTEAPPKIHRDRALAKVAHWSLIEEKPSESTRGSRTSGIWRPTGRGIRFAQGKIALPSHITIYNNIVLKFSDKLTTIQEALADDFDFNELWGRRL